MQHKNIRFYKYLAPFYKIEALVLFLSTAAMFMSLVNPYLTKLVIDQAYGKKDLKLFLILALTGGSIFLFNGLLNSLGEYFSQRIRSGVQFNLTKDLFRHLESLHLSFFQDKSTGGNIYLLTSDINSVSSFISTSLPQAIELAPRFLFILVLVFFLNWKMALFTLLLIPITYLEPLFFKKRLIEFAKAMFEKSQHIFKQLNESFSHTKLVKALGKEDIETKTLEENLRQKIDTELKMAKSSAVSNFFASFLNRVTTGLIALYGGYQVIKGTMTLGSLTAVMIYLTQLLGITSSLVRFYESLSINSISQKRLLEVFALAPLIKDKENARNYQFSSGRVEFKNVSFGYKKDVLILQGMNFSIGSSAKIALVGPSGCGKTTLLNLILRLYESEEGAILIDGLDIREMQLKSLKGQIGIVLQESFLWNDTIAHNILYGREEAIEEEMLKAAQLAEAHNFILGLPRQYQTVAGELACKISEGQKQRLAIARALIKQPKILILDEAMSSLDGQTEDKIVENIKNEFRDSTIIVVSHRLSTVKKMDLVYFLENPSHMQVGRHQELSERNPQYKELFASQIEAEKCPDGLKAIE